MPIPECVQNTFNKSITCINCNNCDIDKHNEKGYYCSNHKFKFYGNKTPYHLWCPRWRMSHFIRRKKCKIPSCYGFYKQHDPDCTGCVIEDNCWHENNKLVSEGYLIR